MISFPVQYRQVRVFRIQVVQETQAKNSCCLLLLVAILNQPLRKSNLNKTYITAILVVTSLAFSAGAMAQSMSKSEYETSKNGISTKLESAKANCRSVTGNRKELTEICVGNAERQGKIAKANLEAHYNPTEQTRNEALDAKVKAKDDYLSKTKKDGAQASLATDADKTVDKQRAANYATANNECNTLGGTAKTTCINNLLEKYNTMSE